MEKNESEINHFENFKKVFKESVAYHNKYKDVLKNIDDKKTCLLQLIDEFSNKNELRELNFSNKEPVISYRVDQSNNFYLNKDNNPLFIRPARVKNNINVLNNLDWKKVNKIKKKEE